MRRRSLKTKSIVLVAAAAFLSASQARPESVFEARAGAAGKAAVDGPVFAMTGPAHFSGGGFAAFGAAAAQDSLEILEIELEEEGRPGMIKEIAMVAIVAGVVGYIVYTLIDPGDDAAPVEEDNGKPIPFSRAPFSIIR